LSVRETYLIYYSRRLDQTTGLGMNRTGMKTIDILFDESQLTIEDIAERSGLTPQRVEAIAVGRWTPSPAERQKIAAAFGVSVDEVSWGHSMEPRNIRYHRFGLKENF